jgi:hypothetical protein
MYANQGPPNVPLNEPVPVFRYGEQSIWSSAGLTGAAVVAGTTTRLFSIQQGGTGLGFAVGASISETNLREAGRVPNNVAYDVFGIACQFLSSSAAGVDGATINNPIDNDADLGSLLSVIQNGVLSWDFTQTTVDVAPVMLIGAGGGAFGALATADTGTPVTTGHMNNGPGSIWLYRRYPVALPGATSFAVLLRFGTRAPAIGANGAIVRCVLLGYYKNVVEVG